MASYNLLKNPKGASVVGLLILSSVLFAFPVDALSPAVVDVRSVGMGNTGSVSATGSNAIFYNPALLGDARFFEIETGGRLSFGSADDQSAGAAKYEARYLPLASFTHLSLVLPIKAQDFLALAPAIGYHIHLDAARNQKLDRKHEMGDLYLRDTMRGAFGTITPALAIQILDKYSIGVAFNFAGILPIRENHPETGTLNSLNSDTTEGYYEHWHFSRPRVFLDRFLLPDRSSC